MITKGTTRVSATRGATIALAFVLAAVPLRAADSDDLGSRIARVAHWLELVLEHTPGSPDRSVIEISTWSPRDLELFRIDAGSLTQLMHDLKISTFQLRSKEVDCADCIARRDAGQPRLLLQGQVIRYTDVQLHRLKVLTCAASGILDDPDCKRLNADREIEAPLRRLAALAATARKNGDRSMTLRRAALLHTDVAMATAGTLRPIDTGTSFAGNVVRVHMVDGEAASVGVGEIHWELSREFVEGILPRPDPWSRDWYIATNAWMQREQEYDTGQLRHARELFPDDAAIAFLNGTQAEAYASPAIQSVVRTAVLPSGLTLTIGNESAELKTAESFLEQATRLDPSFAEAHLHLGHVLLARGKPQDAIAELSKAATTPDPLLQYFDAMFLGAAHESMAHFDEARTAYEHASALFPRAQSPHLALSALGSRRGDRTGALAAIRSVFDLPAESEYRDDPWWRYRAVQGRQADDQLEHVRAPFGSQSK